MKLHEIIYNLADNDDDDPLIVILARKLLAAGQKIHKTETVHSEVVKGIVSDIWMDRELKIVFRYDLGDRGRGSFPLDLGYPDNYLLSKREDGWELHEAA